jgi:hypothetical protein
MGAFSYPYAVAGNPMGTTLRLRARVRVATTSRVRTRCHLEVVLAHGYRECLLDVYMLSPKKRCLYAYVAKKNYMLVSKRIYVYMLFSKKKEMFIY